MAVQSDWAVLQPQLPSVVTDLSEVLDSLVGMLLAILDLVKSVLDVVKAFLVGFIDPVAVLIDAIVEEIEGLLGDIRQIGVYISGDLDVSPPCDDLLGGFTAYERRMVARLIDRNDPTRPAFTSRTTVAAVFLYQSFDSSTIDQAMAFVSEVRRFFGMRGRTKAYTVPAGLNVAYGSSSTGLGAFGFLGDILATGEEPSVANLRWQMAPPEGAGAVSWPIPSPPGFLVEVSTVPDGLTLAYQTPTSPAQADADGNQRQLVGLVADPEGNPFRLYGGSSILDYFGLEWDENNGTYTPPTGAGKTRLFAYRTAADNVPVPPNALVVDGKHVLQRTFFVDVNTVLGINVAAPGQQYSTILRYEDMPYDATFEDAGDGSVTVTVSDEPAREVYVRVSAVTKEVAEGTGDFASSFYWKISQGQVYAGADGVVKLTTPSGVPLSAKGDASAPLKVSFPSAQTSEYLEAVATSLAILVLSRADLIAQGTEDASFQVDTAAEPTGLEALAQHLVPLVLGVSPSRFFKKNYPDVTSFRGKLRARCRAVANTLFSKTGPLPPSVVSLVLEQAEVRTRSGVVKSIVDVTWSDLAPDFDVDATILDSLDPRTSAGANRAAGIAANPVSAGGLDALALEGRIGSGASAPITLARAPGFSVPPDYFWTGVETTGMYARMNTGSADYSPVLYAGADGAGTTMAFCRNVFLDNATVLSAAALVLNIAAAPSMQPSKPGGAWQAYRLFPQGLPPVEAALGEIEAFLNAIRAGLKGVTDAIEAYINFVEARILELEALLQRIQGLLDLVVSIEVPATAGLVVTGAGTDGILQALVTAGNKPSDDSTTVTRIAENGETVLGGTYGLGVVLLAGGLPTSVLELFLLLFPPAE